MHKSLLHKDRIVPIFIESLNVLQYYSLDEESQISGLLLS